MYMYVIPCTYLNYSEQELTILLAIYQRNCRCSREASMLDQNIAAKWQFWCVGWFFLGFAVQSLARRSERTATSMLFIVYDATIRLLALSNVR